MSIATSSHELLSPRRAGSVRRVLTALEILLVYAGILLYIWRWQFTHPRLWVALLAAIVLSHLVYRDSPREMGLTLTNLCPSAQMVLPVAIALYIPFVVYGLWQHQLLLLPARAHMLRPLLLYGSWCVVQQYLTQSYFHRRLMSTMLSPRLRSFTVAIMFGGAHIPNPILMVVTTVGGFILAEVFARRPNIWPLALAQAVGGFLVAALSPVDLIRNMRVGPPYFFYGIP